MTYEIEIYGKKFNIEQDSDGKFVMPDGLKCDGFGTALKPAVEPAVLFQKPNDGTFAHNFVSHGVAGLNLKGCRVGNESIQINQLEEWSGFGQVKEPDYKATTSEGRWPANLILDEEAGKMLDEQSGNRPGGQYPEHRGESFFTAFAGAEPTKGGARAMKDSGGASRFFYCAKAGTKEREAGLNKFGKKSYAQSGGAQAAIAKGEDYNKEIGMNSIKQVKNPHPTLKPISLTTYLAKLLLPPAQEGKKRRILIPFSGVCSEGIGAALAGWDEIIMIEQCARYAKIGRARMKYWLKKKVKNGKSYHTACFIPE